MDSSNLLSNLTRMTGGRLTQVRTGLLSLAFLGSTIPVGPAVLRICVGALAAGFFISLWRGDRSSWWKVAAPPFYGCSGLLLFLANLESDFGVVHWGWAIGGLMLGAAAVAIDAARSVQLAP